MLALAFLTLLVLGMTLAACGAHGMLRETGRARHQQERIQRRLNTY